MEAHLRLQKETVTILQAMLTNYKKDPANRKTLQYINKRLSSLRDHWDNFEIRNKKLQAFKDSEQPYFVENTYEKTKALYEELLETFLSKKDEITNMASSEGVNTEAAEQEQKLLQIVNLHYQSIKKLLDSLQNLDENKTTGYIEVQLNMLIKAWEKFEESYFNVQLNVTNENSYENINLNNIQQQYADICGILHDKIRKPIDTATGRNTNVEQFQLPKFKIPDFDGKISNWSAFAGLFNQMIHNNKTIDNAIKMQYLKTHVKGDASKLISHMDPSAENYETAYTLLKKRYENKRELLSHLLDTILQLPNLTFESGRKLKIMHDTVWECIMAIKNLQISVENWDPLLTHILLKKLDKETVKHYECQLIDIKEPQKLQEFLAYIESRFMALEAAESRQQNQQSNTKKGNTQNVNSTKHECIHCKEQHNINNCQAFAKMQPQERLNWVKNTKLCTNCLKEGHKNNDCKSQYRCKTCKKNHHSLLHIEFKTTTTASTNDGSKNKKNTTCAAAITTHEDVQVPSTSTDQLDVQAMVAGNNVNVLLATAIIKIKTISGSYILVKALIDQCSKSAFITENLAQMLGVPRKKITARISGIGASTKTSNSSIKIEISPRFSSEFKLTTEAVVLERITQALPPITNKNQGWEHLNRLMLADPSFESQGTIDVLLGAAEFSKIIKLGLIKGAVNTPIAQDTELGWIISGQADINKGCKQKIEILTMVTTAEIDQMLQKFFEISEINEERQQTEEEERCEKHYKQTYRRLDNGRYVVKLPFRNNDDVPDIGESRNNAIATLLQLEKRFHKQPELFAQYKAFIDEYISLGHMKIATDKPNGMVNYLPHHAVFKDSSTTKLRVVFDASRKTSNKKSLNDNLAIGPILQTDMTSLLIKWRKHRIVFTADIEKMYRQILIHEDHTELQRIVWRDSPKEKIKEYKLLTVTYGTASAPYLAIRTLQQLAKDEANAHPVASEIIMNDFYVDDVLSGADSINEAISKQIELKTALQKGGFNLRKWTSNNKEFLDTIPENDREIKFPQQINIDSTIKALGLNWNPLTDEFSFKIIIKLDSNAKTKRMLLSEIASLFDPIGWISPVIIKAKILLQELWILGKTWDEELPEYIQKEWQKIKEELSNLEKIKIPRWIETTATSEIELHGFCDASEMAYAAAIYVKSKNINNETKITLLVAKTKVAPIKKLTIPRLELCGALLLARLAKKVINAMQINYQKIYMWSDSKIVLAWLNGNPKRWKTFVANQAVKINAMISSKHWQHISSEDNPADCASRGIYPNDILIHTLWWKGPQWLWQSEENYPQKTEYSTQIEVKTTALTGQMQSEDNSILPSTSSYYKLQRIIAHCVRFIYNCKNSSTKEKGPLTVGQLKKASIFIIKIVQEECFKIEIESLKKQQKLIKTSKIKKLNPFLDVNGILRVGGRLQNANISYDAKHQILLPQKHIVTEHIINMVHNKTIHGGPKLTEAVLRQTYWIINGYHTIKNVIHKCVICHRYNGKIMTQFMGILPTPRVNIDKPFLNCGIDYAGPINIKTSKGRGHKSTKGYIALFICLATKAIHIELVSDLTAEGFIAAYRRFAARRGAVSNIYSDNATNFVKANKILQEHAAQEEAEFNSILYNELAKYETQWHFIPPASPHFGGLWEAGVKSVKTHLMKAIGQSTMTFEELSTLLHQIEASLNSRPLCALSSDPNDVSSLTPGHFLIGAPILAPPDTNMLDVQTNRLTRWQLIQKMHQQFWTKWRIEYLHRLQHRPKWLEKKTEPKINDLVIIKDENLPPSKWALGRILETHPGTDGITRVVTLKTKDNVIKRPVVKISPLPSNNNEETAQKSQVNVSSTQKSNKGTQLTLPVLITMMACLFTKSMANNTSIITTPFIHRPGIFFEQHENAYISNNNWNIVAYYDLQHFVAEYDSIRLSIKRIKDVCEKHQVDEHSCMNTVNQLNTHLSKIKEKNQLILGPQREKRAALDIIGNIASDLFGVLDSRFATEYAQDISKVKNNEEHLLMLLKNQTSITEATVNIIKKDDAAIANQFNRINNMTKEIQQLSNKEEINHRLLAASFHVLTAIIEYESTQTSILDVLLDAHKSYINPNLLTPNQLKQQIHTIRIHIDKSLLVPEGDTHDVKQLYRIMNVQTTIINNKIIFKIKLPLLLNLHFQLFRLISVPTLQNDKYIWIEPSTKYLMATLNRNYHYPLTEVEYNNCIPYLEDKICPNIRQLLTIQAESHICEWKLLNHNTQLDSSCKIKMTAIQDVFIPLAKHNEWIYVIHRKYPIDVICGDASQHYSLSGEGILQIQQECIIRHATMEITARREYKTSFRGSIIPHVNVSDELDKYQQGNYNQSSNTFVRANISTIEEMIKNQREQEKLPEDLYRHHKIYNTLTCMLIVIAAIWIIYRFIKKYKKITNRNTTPTPVPRITRAISMPTF